MNKNVEREVAKLRAQADKMAEAHPRVTFRAVIQLVKLAFSGKPGRVEF